MAALEHADAHLASGPPSLARAEPTLLLPSPALLAARAPVGNRHSLHAHGLNRFLVPLRIKPRVGSRQVRCAPEPSPIFFSRGDQHRGIRWAFREHFVVRDDLVLGLLHLDQFAKLGWLTDFAFANDFRVRLEHAHDLAWKMRDSLEDPGLGLLPHLPHSLGHEFQCFRHLRPACGDAVQDAPLPPSRLGPDSESFASRSEVRRIVSAVAPLVAALAGGSPTQSPSLVSSLCACGRESSCAARRSSPRSSSSCASRPVHRRRASCCQCQWDSECSFPPPSYPPASVVLPRSRALVPIPSAAGANSGSLRDQSLVPAAPRSLHTGTFSSP